MALKKILIAYFSRPPIIDYLKRAFEKKGVEARGFFSDENNWFDRYVIRPINKTAHNFRLIPKDRFLFEDHPLCQLRYRNRKLLEEVETFRPELVMIIRGYRYLPEVLEEVRKKSLLFGWWVEREEGAREAVSEVPYFDHYYFLHSSLAREALKKGFKNTGTLHHSVDTGVFRFLGLEKKYDWCFVGGWSERRQEFIEKAFGVSPEGAVYGPKWGKKFSKTVVKGASIWGEDLVRLYNESRVVLNHTNWGGGRNRSGMTMRVLEGAACGTCLLTDGSRDMESLVTPGEHLVLYRDIEDFTGKLTAILRDGELRERIAAEGLRHVRKNFSYDDIVKSVIKTYNGLKGVEGDA